MSKGMQVQCFVIGGNLVLLDCGCEFVHVTDSQIKALHLYDCLRANKATSAWGLEIRVPFLDKEFIDVAMSIDPKWKMVSDQLPYFEYQ